MTIIWVKEHKFPSWYRLNIARPSAIVGRMLSYCAGSHGKDARKDKVNLLDLAPAKGLEGLLSGFFHSIKENYDDKPIRWWQYCEGMHDDAANHREWLQVESCDDKNRKTVMYTSFSQSWYNPAHSLYFLVPPNIWNGYFMFEELRLPDKKPITEKHYGLVFRR